MNSYYKNMTYDEVWEEIYRLQGKVRGLKETLKNATSSEVVINETENTRLSHTGGGLISNGMMKYEHTRESCSLSEDEQKEIKNNIRETESLIDELADMVSE